nr:MAG TPA: Integrase [Caudoviricetes sp.]
MNYPTTRIVFDRKHVSSNTKEGLVQLEVLFKGVRRYFSTGVKVTKNRWSRSGKVTGCMDMIVMNRRIDEMKRMVDKYIVGLMENEEPFDFDRFKAWMVASDEQGIGFVDWVEKRIAERNDIRKSTKRNHMKLVALLRKIGNIRTFADVTKKNVLKMDTYLHSTGIRQTTIASYHKFMKTYVHDAMSSGLIEKDPYIGVKIDIGKSVWGRFLTVDEVEAIEKAEMPTESLERVKDLFLFQCYTGLAYADLMRFDMSKAVKGEKYYLVTDDRKKTGEGYTVVLMEKAMDILKKYDYKLPKMTCEQYNMRLKIMADACGIEKPIASHFGRRTCGMLLLNYGFPIEIVSKVLGHSNIKTTQQAYAKILDRTVENEFIKKIASQT